jgi:hypothetical protein
MVNPIYCGPAAHPETTEWRAIAKLTDGHFASIDQDHGVVEVATPFDEELMQLGGKLNTTYRARGGEDAKKKRENQGVQDENARALGGSAAPERAAAKASALYRCDWDLVDACKDKACDLAKTDELPEELKKMSLEERKAYVEKLGAEREEIQKKIGELNVKRQAFIAKELEKKGDAANTGFEKAVRDAIHAQAEKKGFAFDAK